MKNNNSSIKPVVAVGIGAALFFVLGRFVAIPSPVPNTNISLQYAVLALLAAMYGPVAGDVIEIAFGQRTVKVEVLAVTENAKKDDAAAMYRELAE